MKRLLVLCLIIFIASCAGVFGDDSYLYQNSQHPFSITFPGGWKIEKNEIREKNNAGINIKATSENGKGLESIGVSFDKLPKYLGNDITVINKDYVIGQQRSTFGPDTFGGETKIGGYRAIWCKTTTSFFKPKWMVQYQIRTLHGGNIYTITARVFSTSKDKAQKSYQYFEPTFKRTMASFKFTGHEKNPIAPSALKRIDWGDVIRESIGYALVIIILFYALENRKKRKNKDAG